MKKKIEKLKECIELFKQKKEPHYLLECKEEHLKIFVSNIVNYMADETFIDTYEYPKFNEEIQVNRADSFNQFPFIKENEHSNELITKFKNTSIEDFLIVLGQRITSATVKDEKGFPCLDGNVFTASFEVYNSQISKAVRAFEKHSERTTNNFWGKAIGNPAEKEEKVKTLLASMLKNKTWWNVYYHYKHELVYEIRISSGHGARWKKENLEFIGFVEPFKENSIVANLD